MSAETHNLKTWPVYFERVWQGEKTFEIRLDDRGYQKGDTAVLREWDRKVACGCPLAETRGDHQDDCARYSGRTVTARIGCVLASTPARGSQRGFTGNGYVVFSLVDPVKVDGRATAAPLAPATAIARIAAATPASVTP